MENVFVLAIIALALCGATIALTAWGIVLPRTRASARVREIGTYGFPAGGPSPAAIRRSPLLDLANRLGAFVAERLGRRYEERVKRLLIEAGMYKVAPRSVMGAQFLTAGLCGVAVTAVGVGATPATRFAALLVAAAVGFALPLVAILNRGLVRRERVERKVPDMIDMLVVTIEAGLGFGASMQACSTRTRGPLGEELRLVMQEQDMGETLRDALFHCADRTRSRSMNSFVRAVTQGEALGVSIGTVMRGIAEEMRVRRRQEAEERAQKAPVKMLFPLIFLMFPALMIVILGPAMFEIFKVLGGM